MTSEVTQADQWRKKPVVITAVQINTQQEAERHSGICTGGYGCKSNGAPDGAWPHIHTLEGDHTWTPGDWCITGVKGERYFCKPDIFAQTYEPAHRLAHRGGEVVEPRTIYVQWADNGNIRKWAWSEFDLAEKIKVETMPVSDTPFAWAYHYTQKHPGQTKPGAMDIKRDRHKGPIAAGWTETPLYAAPPTDEVARLREALRSALNTLQHIGTYIEEGKPCADDEIAKVLLALGEQP